MIVGAVLNDDKAYRMAIRAEDWLCRQIVNIKTGDYSIHTGPFIQLLVLLLSYSAD
jgi:hypothetical protein